MPFSKCRPQRDSKRSEIYLYWSECVEQLMWTEIQIRYRASERPAVYSNASECFIWPGCCDCESTRIQKTPDARARSRFSAARGLRRIPPELSSKSPRQHVAAAQSQHFNSSLHQKNLKFEKFGLNFLTGLILTTKFDIFFTFFCKNVLKSFASNLIVWKATF